MDSWVIKAQLSHNQELLQGRNKQPEGKQVLLQTTLLLGE